MRFHWPSFLLGYVLGVGSATAADRLRPLALEIATTVYRAMDAAAARLVMKREALEDFFAEARARARGILSHPAVH